MSCDSLSRSGHFDIFSCEFRAVGFLDPFLNNKSSGLVIFISVSRIKP